MATVGEIVNFGECLAYLGLASTATNAQLGMVQMSKQFAERAMRRWMRCNIVQATYTHIGPWADGYDMLEVGVLARRRSNILALPEYPVRSITTLWEDENAMGGSASGAFPTSSQLTIGNDFYEELLLSGYNPNGNLIRRSLGWPGTPGSIKITYVAGWTAAELDGDVSDASLDFSDIKLGVLKTVSEFYNEAIRSQSSQGAGGMLKSETLGDYSYTIDTSVTGGMIHLPSDVKLLVGPFRRLVVA